VSPDPAPSLLPPELPPGVVLAAETHTYRVVGRDLATLTASMRASGFGTGTAAHAQGLHVSRLRWHYHTHAEASQCVLDTVIVTIESEIFVPSWDPPSSARVELRAQWRDFLAALEEHEQGHRALTMVGAMRLRDSLLALRASRCGDLGLAVQVVGNRLSSRIHADNAHYDDVTQHGATQGAVWPPMGFRAP